jgi:o-succinylbenzoate synthase
VTAIASLRADLVAVPFRRPFATATGMWVERQAWLLRLTDADGRSGLGEAVLEPADGETAGTVLRLLIREAVASAARGELPGAEELEAHGRPGRALRAAIEAALLDLRETPSGRLVGAAPGVGVNATLPALGPAASAEAARQAVAAGFRTLKLKAGAERETEPLVDRLRAVRDAVGPDVRLRLDANGAWDAGTAAERLAAVARFELEYVEQPLAGDDVAALAGLRRRARVPIAADETVASLRAVRELLDAEAVDVLVVKPSRVGGPAAVAQIGAIAHDHGVPVVVSTLFETGIGIAAALAAAAGLPEAPLPGFSGAADHGAWTRDHGAWSPGHGAGAADHGAWSPDHGLATAGLLEHDLLAEGLVVADGRMRLPRRDEDPTDVGGPAEGAPAPAGGLGVTLDERAVARYRVETVEAVP